MSRPGDCPNLALLRDFAAGLLTGGSAETVQAHLDGCERCREALTALDTIEEKPSPEDAPASLPAAGEQLTVEDSHNVPREPTEESEDPSDLHFLEPTSNPRALGRLGAYEVFNVLGRGGMGVVLKAFDTSLHRTVAIKVLSPALAASPKARRRFQREARAAAGINHPNVVTIHAVDEHHGAPYLVMEFIPGQTLRQRIRTGGPFDLASLLRIGAQIAAGLAAAHQHGVIHRDIKPSNVMLENGIERVKITDFGLALVVIDRGQITSAGHVLGTPAYMAPEQVAGARPDARSDLFSLGCVLYAMATGSSPFQGSHALDIARRVTDHHPPPLHTENPAIPRPVSDVVARLLEKDPGRRYQSAEEVRDLLLGYLAPLQGSTPQGTPLPRPASPPRSRRRRWYTAGGVFLAVLLAAFGVWWAGGLFPGPPPDGPPDDPPGLLTVAREGKARFSSLREAVSHAKPGTTIRILDRGIYQGPITIDARRLAGLTIESPHGATLQTDQGTDPVIFVGKTPGVTIRGVVIRARDQQHGISVVGTCEGLTVERVRLHKPPGSAPALLVLWPGAGGSEKRPIVLRDLDVQCGGLGVAVLGKPDQPATAVRIQRCRFSGPGPQLTLEKAVRDVVVSDNVFTDGGTGVSLQLDAPGASGKLLIANNTFFGVSNWLGLAGCSFDHPEVLIANNLVLQATAIDFGAEGEPGEAPRWFRGNWWEPEARADREQVRRFAELKAGVRLRSREADSPGFLRPAPGTMPSAGGQGTLPHGHVGALAPD
jgi:serine/threonine protein kinase